MIRKALIFISFCGPALADAPKVDCDNAMTQTDRNICSYQDYQAADAVLYEGGSIQPLITNSCLADLTRQRTDEMRSAYQTY
ncbi:lysozyme inhibitor LprI family protein [Celeribacter baekdonensis]|uniref:lysozyme inhibitor LprI family protein n=1 Tax=Celeribacter baekdonensis TaxID=875171 RepID=UPI003A8CF273